MQRRKYALLKQPFELDALADVSLTNPVLGDVVYFDGTYWLNTPYAELVDDRVAALLVAGNNIDITYNDGSGTITIDVETLTSADISDFNEAVDDRVNSLLVAGAGIAGSYNDGSNTYTLSLDINELSAGTVVDPAADYYVMYDASATANVKILPENATVGSVTVRARNTTGSTITKGSAVYINGSAGASLPTIALAKADALATSRAIGLAQANIPNNSNGVIVTVGTVDGINTSAFSAGDTVFVSPTTAGALTATRPTTAGQFVHVVGVVTIANAGTGEIKVVQGVLSISASFGSADISDFNEAVDDRVDALVTAGVALTKNYNDVGNSYTLDFDIPELTAETVVDVEADYFVYYDNSATAHRKLLPKNLPAMASASAPASASSSGVAGMVAYDSSYIYVCVAANTWVRAALATW